MDSRPEVTSFVNARKRLETSISSSLYAKARKRSKLSKVAQNSSCTNVTVALQPLTRCNNSPKALNYPKIVAICDLVLYRRKIDRRNCSYVRRLKRYKRWRQSMIFPRLLAPFRRSHCCCINVSFVSFCKCNQTITVKTFTETVRVVDFGRMVEYQADLLLPTNKKIDCKVKYLKHDHEKRYLSGFFDLYDFWARLDSPYIIRLFGITVQSNNRCLILESYQSDLKCFLRERKARREEVPTVNLIDAAQCLAKALYYLVSEWILR